MSSSRQLFGVFGVSGLGRETLPLARDRLQKQPGCVPADLVFVDDSPPVSSVNGHRVFTYNEFLAASADEKFINVAIADSAVREKVIDRCASDGVRPFSLVASTAIVMDDVVMGPGALIQHFVIVTSNVRIGAQFHANINCYVAHDCVIGDYVTLAPGVMCNGNVTLEDHAYIGAGALLRNGKPGSPLIIGRGAVVGMGAVVIRNVAPGTTVVGNPARPLIK